GYMHAATVARARTLEGPFEDSPYTPLMTTRDEPTNPLQKSGHCCFLQIGDEWYVTQICGRPLTERGNCTLGRETAIQKIYWTEDGWPRLINNTISPDLTVPAPAVSQGVVQKTDHSERIDFAPDAAAQACAPLTSVTDPAIPPSLKTLRCALSAEKDYSLTARPGWLRLYGDQSLRSQHHQVLFARRWEAYDFDADTVIDFDPKNYQQVAGLILYYDTQNWIYAYVSFDSEGTDRRILQVLRCDHEELSYGSEAVALDDGPVRVKVEVRHAVANFFYAQGDGVPGGDADDSAGAADGAAAGTTGTTGTSGSSEPDWRPLGGDQPADHISDDYVERTIKGCAFTGGMVGICAQDMDAKQSHADFKYFDYQER
ncbi:family 43 glycosylhydrolase, partial [Bifidobacterium sp. 82T10]